MRDYARRRVSERNRRKAALSAEITQEGETGEAPPVADEASLFRGRLPISGYKVSADWLEPTVYPFLGFPRTPFLTVAENLPLYRQSRYTSAVF